MGKKQKYKPSCLSAAIRFEAVVLLLSNAHSVGVLCWLLFCYSVLQCVFYSFAIILTKKRKLVALLLLSSWRLVTVRAHDAVGCSAVCECGIHG